MCTEKCGSCRAPLSRFDLSVVPGVDVRDVRMGLPIDDTWLSVAALRS